MAKVPKAALLLALLLSAFIGYAAEGVVPGMRFVGASPLNGEWDGTFLTASLIGDAGYDVVLVASWSDTFPRLCGYRRVLLVVISPEVPFSRSDEELLAELRSCVAKLTVLVADEGGYANAVLEALDVPVEIRGGVFVTSSGGSPYPRAVIKLPGGDRRVLFLDYAAPLVVRDGATVIGRSGGDAIAALYETDGLSVVVLGDGSLFLNHLVAIGGANPYRALLADLLRYARPDVVAIDAKHYRLASRDLWRLLYISPSVGVAAVINPVYWLLASLEPADRVSRGLQIIASHGIAGPIIVGLLAYLAAPYISRALLRMREFVEDRISWRRELRYTVMTRHRSIADVRSGIKYEDAAEALHYLRAVVSAALGRDVIDLREGLLELFSRDPKIKREIEMFFEREHRAREILLFVLRMLKLIGMDRALSERALKLWALGR